MAAPFIVMCAPNGARKTQDDHTALPIAPAELADCAESILDAGAAVMHLHVRDADCGHSLDVSRYRAAIDAIRSRVGHQLILQVTTESCGTYTPAQQMAVVRELEPEAVSVALRELCPDSSAENVAGAFYDWMRAAGIMVQHILYGPDEVLRFALLRERGVIPGERPFALFVLGRYADTLTGDPRELDDFVAACPDDLEWAVCCFGSTEQEAVGKAAGMGGHARVGFENNLQLPNGDIAPDNSALVSLAAERAPDSGRTVATADDVRKLFVS